MTALIHKISTSIARLFNRKEIAKTLIFLNKIEQSKRRLQFQFQGDTRHFSCTVETVNAEHGVLVVGNIFPKADSLNLQRNRKLVLATTESSGARVQLASKFLEPLIGESGQFLLLTLPRKVQVCEEQQPYQVTRAGISSARNQSVGAGRSESQAA